MTLRRTTFTLMNSPRPQRSGKGLAAAPPGGARAGRAGKGISGSLIDSSIALLQRRPEADHLFCHGLPAAEAIPSADIARLAAEILRDPVPKR